MDKIGVREIGLKSTGASGTEIFGIGTMSACFHCTGTIDEFIDILKRVETGSAIIGADNFRNQAGRSSKPTAVGLR